MTQEIANRETAALAAPALTREKIELIKRTVAKGATDDELQLFLHVAQRSGLDPFARQIYAIKRWDSRERKEVMQPQTSIDGYRLIASRTGRYVPGPKPSYAYAPDGKTLVSATAYIKVLAGNEWHTVEAEAFWDEYAVTYEKDGKKRLGPMWEKMPHVMLAKCAEALVIRRAFPNETQGIYTAEEMGRANSERPVIAPKVAAQPEAEENFDPETGEIIEPGDDGAPDSAPAAADRGRKLSPKQQAYLFGLAKKKGWEEADVKAYTGRFFKKPDPTQLSSAELDDVLRHLHSIPDVSQPK